MNALWALLAVSAVASAQQYDPVEEALTNLYGARCRVVAPRYTPEYGRCLLDSMDKDAAESKAKHEADAQRQAQTLAAKRALALQLLSGQPGYKPLPAPTVNVPHPVTCTTTVLAGVATTRCQ